LFLGLIISTNGIPYILDSNETYSNLWHAFSIHSFGLEGSKGLADEVFSPTFESHPFIHSHQGNFPRLFSWLIYELGATSAQSQIIVTTFTVGLATIFIAYSFFSRIFNRNFAMIFVLVLITDYILFAQWQVVTYRVWSGFLFYSQLMLLSLYVETSQRRWLCGLYFSSLCLLYSELIFAAFVGLVSFLWLASLCLTKYKKFITASLVMFLGAITGISIFLYQAILYFGWNNFLRDIQLTYGSRNNYQNITPEIKQEIASFYSKNHVIFWENFQDKSQFLGLRQLIQSFTSFDWQVHTPFFSGLLLVPILAVIVTLILPVDTKFNISKNSGLNPSKSRVLTLVFNYFLLSLAGFVILYFFIQGSGLNLATSMSAIDIVYYVIFSTLFSSLVYAYLDRASLSKLFVFFAFLFIYGISCDVLYDFRYEFLWTQLHQIHQKYLAIIFFFLAIFSSIEWIAFSSASDLKNLEILKFRKIFGLIIVMLTGYSLVYFLSPGYIYSGYLVRYAPLTVFISDIFVALAFYIIYRIVVMNIENMADAINGIKIVKISLTSLSLIIFIGLWIQIQASYVKILPPSHFSFLKKLSAQPYKGKSFVVDNYAAPVAAYTLNWAYMDYSLSNGYIESNGNLNQLIGNNQHIWFADKDLNQAYRRPDYYLCMIPQSISTAFYSILYNKGMGTRPFGCLDKKIVKIALNKDHYKGLTLVDFDKEGLKKFGFVSWAIIKFDWNADIGNEILWR
jgi:hypothetical protein